MILPLLVATLSLGGTSDGLPAKSPGSVGMSAERLAAIDRVVTRGISAGGYPGAAVVVGRKGAAVFAKGYGRLGWTTESGRVSADRTIYDLASLTKVVGTATAVMVLFDQGRLSLDTRVVTILPAFTGGLKDSVTVHQLLTHRGGLPAGRDLWRIARSPEEAREKLLETQLVYPPAGGYIYSDIGADILGMIVEKVSGERLDRFLDRNVFKPLGMNDTFFRPADSLVARIAPTEVSPPRGYPLRGEVHDENAYALGGVAGHAGLFSTASDLAVFAQMMLNGGAYNGVRIFSDSTVAIFTRRAAGTRALGWDTANGDYGSGTYLSERAYGHTGFTGTSMWIDPDRQMFVVLLTNRVHAAKARRPAKVISDVRADLADAAAIAVTDDPANMLKVPRAYRADRAIGWNRPTRAARGSSARRGRSSAASSRSRTSSSRSASSRAASTKKPTAKKPTTTKKPTPAKKPSGTRR